MLSYLQRLISDGKFQSMNNMTGFHGCKGMATKSWYFQATYGKKITSQRSATGDQTVRLNEQRMHLSSRLYVHPVRSSLEFQSRYPPPHLILWTRFPQRHLQDLTTMLESCSTRGVRPMKYMMVRGSRSWGTQQGEAEASGFSLLYRGRIWAETTGG